MLKFDTQDITVEEYLLPAEKLIEGNPKQFLWNHYSSDDGAFFSGYWQSEVGKWRVSYSEEEYCQIVKGESIVTDKDGNEQVVKAGDSFVIPSGFEGTWEVVEETKKIYVIYEKQ